MTWEMIETVTEARINDPLKGVILAINKYVDLFSGVFGFGRQMVLNTAERTQLKNYTSNLMKLHMDHVCRVLPLEKSIVTPRR